MRLYTTQGFLMAVRTAEQMAARCDGRQQRNRTSAQAASCALS